VTLADMFIAPDDSSRRAYARGPAYHNVGVLPKFIDLKGITECGNWESRALQGVPCL
jgi:hypothetical protein